VGESGNATIGWIFLAREANRKGWLGKVRDICRLSVRHQHIGRRVVIRRRGRGQSALFCLHKSPPVGFPMLEEVERR